MTVAKAPARTTKGAWYCKAAAGLTARREGGREGRRKEGRKEGWETVRVGPPESNQSKYETPPSLSPSLPTRAGQGPFKKLVARVDGRAIKHIA